MARGAARRVARMTLAHRFSEEFLSVSSVRPVLHKPSPRLNRSKERFRRCAMETQKHKLYPHPYRSPHVGPRRPLGLPSGIRRAARIGTSLDRRNQPKIHP
jgi:hypothetical protein